MATPAKTALYANWQTGFSDGDAVGTFAARSGTTNTQTASSTERPLFKTSILNGQPVLRFDGTNDKMSGTWQNVTAWEVAVVVVPRDLSNFNVLVSANASSNLNHRQIFLDYRGGNAIGWYVSNPVSTFFGSTSSRTVNVAAIEMFRFGSGTLHNWQNGTSVSGSIPTTNVSTFQIGANQTLDFGQIDIGAVVVFDANLDEPNRKRLAHSLAYTFKIDCK